MLTEFDSSGIGLGQPSKAVIDATNNFIYVLDNLLSVTIYREALLTAGSGDCSDTVGFPTGGGNGDSGSVDYLLLAFLFLLGLAKYQRRSSAAI